VRRRNAAGEATGRTRKGLDAPCCAADLTAADVRQVLSQEIRRVMANPDLDPLRRGVLLTQLARVALHAIELSTLEARVEAVEAALKSRKDTNNLKRSHER
jgi:hypothetical protein